MSLNLSDPVSSLRMVGPTYAKKLSKLNITTIEDLLLHIPHRYEDYSLISPISKLQAGETVTIQGEVIDSKNVFTRSGKKIQQITLADKSGHIEVTWFNQPFIITSLTPGTQVSLAGKVDFFGPHLSLVSPQWEIINSQLSILNLIHTGRLVPVYPETYGVSSKWLRSRIYPLLNFLPTSDHLPPSIRKQFDLIDWSEAIKTIHFPSATSPALPAGRHVLQATRRLAFDELFELHLAGLIKKLQWQQQKLTHRFSVDQNKILQFISSLPFTLTSAQKRAIKDILADLNKSTAMNRLLVGDVGSGKTVVAATSIYVAFLNNFQSLLMAPTQILAHQHEQTLRTLLEPLGVKTSLLTSSLKPSALSIKQSALLIGTHALLHHPELLKNLGLVVIDEQHRFGVSQRALLAKSHTLSLTATPIPRTIALTFYGNLDVSFIDEMPQGRLPVKTWVVPPHKRASAYRWIADQIKTKKSQAFIVCPLIEQSESESLAQVKAATLEYEHLKTAIFPDLKLDLLHGKIKAKDKNTIIHRFAQGETDILVATPVVEVGLDIPKAAIMLIEASERFGLAQLHQLRGRVGRRNQQAYCLLFTGSKSPSVVSRLKHLETENSGLKLAETDLKLRGPGELYGTKQHGFAELKVASLTDSHLIQETRAAAESLIKIDPALDKHPLLKFKISHLLSVPIEPN